MNDAKILLNKTISVVESLLQNVENELNNSFVAHHLDCAEYLTDDEFETLQGLHKKIELLKEERRKTEEKK
jgi:hypothetical protein